MQEGPTAPIVAARFKADRAVAMARRLRKSMTPAERALWFQLRRLPLEGSHFRRQAPIGSFIADFVCHGAKLIVEIDGGVHGWREVAQRDAERERWIESRGYEVLRFANAEVASDVGKVVREIYAAVSARMRA